MRDLLVPGLDLWGPCVGAIGAGSAQTPIVGERACPISLGNPHLGPSRGNTGSAIKSPQIVEFLKALSVTIGKKMLLIWDRLQAHRSILVREYIDAQRGAIALEFLPAYAPELNPVECIRGYLKSQAMPNFCARDLAHLKQLASSRLRSMQRRSNLITAFWKQAELF